MRIRKILLTAIMAIIFLLVNIQVKDITAYLGSNVEGYKAYALNIDNNRYILVSKSPGGSSSFKSGSFKSSGGSSSSFKSGSFRSSGGSNSKSFKSGSFSNTIPGSTFKIPDISSGSSRRSFLPLPIPIPFGGGQSIFGWNPFFGILKPISAVKKIIIVMIILYVLYRMIKYRRY